jgi:hypothetical protein
MKTADRNILLVVAAVGLTASATGFCADPNKVERYGRDSVTVWNSHVALAPPSAMPRGVQPSLGYGRAGGPPRSLCRQRTPSVTAEGSGAHHGICGYRATCRRAGASAGEDAQPDQ